MPTDGKTNAVGLAVGCVGIGRALVWIPHLADAAIGTQCNAWCESPLRCLQSMGDLLYGQIGILHVGILLKNSLDE